MSALSVAKQARFSAEAVLANVSLRVLGDRPKLLSFVFHGLFADQAEVESGIVDPQQGITIDFFRRFIQYFAERAYQFVSPDDLNSGLDARAKCVLLTFDDGYYNHIRALSVLEEFKIPALFFISTGHIISGKGFWWDVVYRKLRENGTSLDRIRRAQEAYKRFEAVKIESDLQAELGPRALMPLGDLDRPFTSSELKQFANHKLVFLGNHTRDHAILTNYSGDGIKQQIQGAQDDLFSITGMFPEIIAYPNGSCSRDIVEAAKQAGLRAGVLAHSGRNRLPLGGGSSAAMLIKREMIWGSHRLEAQCQIARAGFSFHQLVRVVKCVFPPRRMQESSI
jgi:peptidoglycan/xylan/chitin deacetylase (PgdA/CDA1 family)